MVFRTTSMYRSFLHLLIVLPETVQANGRSSQDVPQYNSKLDTSEHPPYTAHFSENSERAPFSTPPPFQFPDFVNEDLSLADRSQKDGQEVKTDRKQEAFSRTRPGTEGRKSSFRCPHDLYTCQNNECVAHSARCDDHPDCSDQSDEAGCPEKPKTKPSRPRPGATNNKEPKYKPTGRPGSPTMDNVDPDWAERKKTLPCGAGLWSCVDKSLCILPLQRCDGTNNCHDGSDEWECGEHREYAAYLHSPIIPTRPGHGTSEWKCTRGFYTCKNRQCIVPSFRCDGKKHCHDGSDEWDCGPETIRQLMDERDKRKASRAEEEKEAFVKQERFAKMMEKERQRMQEEEGFTVPDVSRGGSEGDKEEL